MMLVDGGLGLTAAAHVYVPESEDWREVILSNDW